MQISLRSQMIAGTTAIVGAAAVAMTPIAPAVQLPALSSSNAAVALAAYANPFSALFNSINLGVNYVINGNYSVDAGGGATNWPAAGISDYVNAGVLPYPYWSIPEGSGPLPSITNVGLIPNFLTVPFPVGTQVVNNWIGYVNTAYQAGAQLINAGLNLRDRHRGELRGEGVRGGSAACRRDPGCAGQRPAPTGRDQRLRDDRRHQHHRGVVHRQCRGRVERSRGRTARPDRCPRLYREPDLGRRRPDR